MGATALRRVTSYPPDRWLTLSLGVAALFSAWPPAHDGGLSFMVLVGLFLVSLRFRVGPLALVGLLVVGIELRAVEFGSGLSDVPETIRVTLNDVLHGGNPYAPSFDPAYPNRQPFPYGPLALLWYLPLRDPRLVELGVSLAMLAVLAVRGRPLGLAIWAAAPLLIQLASDGSNDHSAALFILVSLIVAERLPRAGALLLGLAGGFKIYALAWLPPIFFWAGAGALAAGLLGFVAAWLPAALLWGAGSILATFQHADAVHIYPYFSVGEALARLHIGVPRGVLDTVRLVAGTLTAVIVSPFARSHGAVLVAGSAIYFVTLFAGYWGTPAYLVPLAAILCWWIDVRLGPRPSAEQADPSRVRWPRDPVGRWVAWLDERWPSAGADRIAAQ